MKKVIFLLVIVVFISCNNNYEEKLIKIKEEDSVALTKLKLETTTDSKVENTDIENSTDVLTKSEDMSTKAYTISKDFVKRKLKSPSTADFPFLDYRYTNLGNDEHKVVAYVDSKNSYGAEIRTYFRLTLKYKGGDWADINNWTLVSEEYE